MDVATSRAERKRGAWSTMAAGAGQRGGRQRDRKQSRAGPGRSRMYEREQGPGDVSYSPACVCVCVSSVRSGVKWGGQRRKDRRGGHRRASRGRPVQSAFESEAPMTTSFSGSASLPLLPAPVSSPGPLSAWKYEKPLPLAVFSWREPL